MFKDETNENLEKDVLQLFINGVIYIILSYLIVLLIVGAILFVLSIETIHFPEGHLICIVDWDDILPGESFYHIINWDEFIIKNAPTRS